MIDHTIGLESFSLCSISEYLSAAYLVLLDVNLLVDFVSSADLGKLTEVCERRRCFIVRGKKCPRFIPRGKYNLKFSPKRG